MLQIQCIVTYIILTNVKTNSNILHVLTRIVVPQIKKLQFY